MHQKAYIALVEEKRAWYKTLKRCFCSVLGEYVYFNSKGFYHLQYNGFGNRRKQGEIIERLTIIDKIPLLLETAKRIVEYRKQKEFQYWELRERVEGYTISVVLRKSNKGNLNFHSAWIE